MQEVRLAHLDPGCLLQQAVRCAQLRAQRCVLHLRLTPALSSMPPWLGNAVHSVQDQCKQARDCGTTSLANAAACAHRDRQQGAFAKA